MDPYRDVIVRKFRDYAASELCCSPIVIAISSTEEDGHATAAVYLRSIGRIAIVKDEGQSFRTIIAVASVAPPISLWIVAVGLFGEHFLTAFDRWCG